MSQIPAITVGIPIPQFIAKVAEGDFRGAFDIISSANALPRISGRVCPQETQCEGKCVRGIKNEPVAIGRLERFVADWAAEHAADIICVDPQNGHKAAVIGSGPAGLTCAGELARKGFDVTVFEAFHVAGGVLSYGIPEFRLPKSIVASQVEKLKELGVKFDNETSKLCEIINVKAAEVLGRYKEDFYAGSPAFTVNSYGKGRAYYQATFMNSEFSDKFYSALCKELCIRKCLEADLPHGVTTGMRTSEDGTEYIFIQNFMNENAGNYIAVIRFGIL